MLRAALAFFVLILAPSVSRAEVHVPMRGITAGTFYLEAQVAGLGNIEFLVDTGSGYTAINADMLAEMENAGGVEFVKQLEGVMADGSIKVVPVYSIPEIRIGTCLLRDVEAAVLGDSTRPILGMRALSRMAPFTFSTSPPGISLAQCDAVVAAQTPPGNAPDTPVAPPPGAG